MWPPWFRHSYNYLCYHKTVTLFSTGTITYVGKIFRIFFQKHSAVFPKKFSEKFRVRWKSTSKPSLQFCSVHFCRSRAWLTLLYQTSYCTKQIPYYQTNHFISHKPFYTTQSPLYHTNPFKSNKPHCTNQIPFYQTKPCISNKALYIEQSPLYRTNRFIKKQITL